MLVASNFGKKFETLEAAPLEPFEVKFVAKNSMGPLPRLGSGIVGKCPKDELFPSSLVPGSDALVYYGREVVVLYQLQNLQN